MILRPIAAPFPRAAELRFWRPLALGVATVLAYLPALRAGFVWDDNAHVTATTLRSWSGLGRIWADPGATQQYYPLLHSAFWLEHRLWGDSALGYHVANLALHLGVVALFLRLLHRLAVPGAWFAAGVFALHPVQVESVAWISEQKNTLSTLCYLGAALVYLRHDTGGRRSDYWLAFLLFALALLTKTVTATLPAALLAIVWWRRGKLSWTRDVLPLAPWLVVGALAGAFTAWIERALIGAEGAAFDLSLVQHAALAARIVLFYLGKLLWPAGLAFVYPRWSLDAGVVRMLLPVGGVLVLAATCWLVRHRSRAPLTALLLFTGSLFPVLGFFNVYPFQFSFVADHFSYLASLGAIAFAGAAFARLLPGDAGAVRFGALMLLAALGALTWRQSHDYRDSETLFRATLRHNPSSWMAHNNLGKELLADRARLPAALASFTRAVELRPDFPEALNNLGLALAQSGRPFDAVAPLEAAVRLKPQFFQAHNNLGIALASSGRAREALASFSQAAALSPTSPNVQENWAKALRLLGRDPEADAHFTAAARLKAAAARPP